ncbi:hypothetical protein [Hymenobacter sp. HDW8]|uniref:hypothetical protein n=1 Tax=Hymenobacter sp. HDW8 TaxID=2714932 RepID=UPI001407C035|nr:hypothetical protein [Hymenobacter sp. HDW8]QIL75662.1 hypothetical protein G7064_07225 [Hymenobacter sp. HDW8]
MIDNTEIMQAIGDEQGYQVYFSGDTETERKFHVIIHGACDNAFVTVNGVYADNKYSITDTLIVDCKGDTSYTLLSNR